MSKRFVEQTDSSLDSRQEKNMDVAKSLTIIVPIHQISHGLENFKSWIRDPTILDSQVILIHDSSDGESFLPVKEFCEDLKNVIFLEGFYDSPGLTRNAGLEKSDREWIAFWDFDDVPDPKYFLNLIRKTKNERNFLGVGAFRTSRKSENSINTIENYFRSENPRTVFDLMSNPGLWRWVFARELVGSARFEATKRGEDQLFLARVDAFSYQITFFQEKVYTYFIGDINQLSARVKHDPELLITARNFHTISKQISGNSRLFAQVGFLAFGLSFLKRTFSQQHIFASVPLGLQVIRVMLKSPKATLLVMQRHSVHDSFDNLRGQTVNLFLAGGLGNQLFQIAFVSNYKYMSRLVLHQPSLEIVALIESGLLNDLKARLPEMEISVVHSMPLIRKLSRNQALRLSSNRVDDKFLLFRLLRSTRLRILNFTLDRQSTLIVPNGIGHDPKIDFNDLNKSLSIVGYFQSHASAAIICGNLSSSLLKMFEEKIDLDVWLNEIEVDTSAVVHLRLGDYLQKKNSKFGVVTDQYLESAINQIQDCCEVKNVVIFSNEPEFANQLLAKLNLSKTTIIPKNVSALECLYLYSKGSKFVVSNSTFSWWGAFISLKQDKIVVAPKPWFKGYEENTDLIPPNWIRCDSGW